MSEIKVLGIDCGGTHTDAALLCLTNGHAKLLARAKTVTDHDNLPACIKEVVRLLNADLRGISRVTLGTTLAINAIVEGRHDKVGLAVSAGPGLDPRHFIPGEPCCIVPGGLDHRGVETGPLALEILAREAAEWPAQGVTACASVGKFSPRNPAHEIAMAKTIEAACGLKATMGHSLSGKLNFPRRITTAYYNAAIARLHREFMDAVQTALLSLGINAPCRLLKADGGAAMLHQSGSAPVQSLLSGPAASVMGCLALVNCADAPALLLDVGGTTTDIALVYKGSPVLARKGMEIVHRHTLIRSLATTSIAIGGDSALGNTQEGKLAVGPQRLGPAMAFGGDVPTLMDALNLLTAGAGDTGRSREGLEKLAASLALPNARALAESAVEMALGRIVQEAYRLVEQINSLPIYTIAGLKNISEARPERALLVGGPAAALQERLEPALGLPVAIPPHADVANAVGAALAIPTAQLELYADTGSRRLWVPALDLEEKIPSTFSLPSAKARACQLLEEILKADGVEDAPVEVVEADLFATLDDYGHGSQDMRVVAQVRPGIEATVA